jgi:F-type H+-transporting ATPase subunit gamma
VAGGQERILRRRIRSVQSTKKITRAMELIAASRIVKAQQRVLAARPYAEQITHVISNLAAAGAGTGQALLEDRPDVRTVGYVVITADRGLCGGYNANVLRAAERDLKAEVEAGRGYALFCVGRKAEGYFRYRGYELTHVTSGISDQPSYEDARGVAAAVVAAFEAAEVDLVKIVSTKFISAGSQAVAQQQYLPLERVEAEVGAASADYEFEPSPGAILTSLLPRYAESKLYAAMLDAAASEHAARQRAMKAATDNADELIRNLTRVMNRARQDAITTEIMEIVSGAEALRQAATGSNDLLLDRIERDDYFIQRDQEHQHA